MKLYYTFCLFPNSIDRIKKMKGLPLEQILNRSSRGTRPMRRDQNSSIFPTGLVVAGGYFIMGIKGSETFQRCIIFFLLKEIAKRCKKYFNQKLWPNRFLIE